MNLSVMTHEPIIVAHELVISDPWTNHWRRMNKSAMTRFRKEEEKKEKKKEKKGGMGGRKREIENEQTTKTKDPPQKNTPKNMKLISHCYVVEMHEWH